MKFNLYFAKVVDNDDSKNSPDKKKENRIQIKVSPFMDEFTQTHLPWARPALPAITGATASSGVSSIPAKDSYVWVWFEDEDNFKKAYYVFDGRYPNNTLAEKFYNDVKPKLDKLSSIPSPASEYPNVVSFHYENGICISYDTKSDNPVIVTYHPKGSYTIIDKDGNIGIYSEKDIQVKTKDGVEFKTNAKNTEFVDGNNNKIETTATGITITDKSTNKVDMSASAIDINSTAIGKIQITPSGVSIGGSGATEPIVLGTKLITQLATVYAGLIAHTHEGNLGIPTSPSAALAGILTPEIIQLANLISPVNKST